MAADKRNPPVYPVPAGDPEMRAAMERARATFPDFIREIEADSRRAIPAVATALVKGYFSDEDNEGEHMWVDVENWDDTSVTGTLASQPGHVESVSAGDTVRVPLERLSDWLYVIDGVAHGGFTVRLLRQRMSAEQRREHDQHYPFSFEEA